MKVCLVTIAIGKKYIEKFNKIFRQSQEDYAKKCTYSYEVITDYISQEYPHPDTISLNKILVCSCDWSMNYDIVIFIDADILINIKAPPIHLEYNFSNIFLPLATKSSGQL